jgi:ABC-2 type transport system ATP-binding protein
MTPALKISHLRKVYRRGTVAVEDISLTIPEGEFFGFLGPNGAGKSTTIHCTTGIAEPTSGTIEIFGVDAVKDYRQARRLVGLCPQEFNVDVFATPRQIVDWMGGYFGMGAKERKSRIDMLMERFELIPHQKKMFRELSGGLKRRVVLARALINDPKLLILDEPTAGVDVELRHVLWRYLAEINRDGKTILLTSHYLEEVDRLCRQVAIVNKGRIVREGTKEDIASGEGGLEGAYLAATGAAAEQEAAQESAKGARK